jgi:hypothetical protein
MIFSFGKVPWMTPIYPIHFVNLFFLFLYYLMCVCGVGLLFPSSCVHDWLLKSSQHHWAIRWLKCGRCIPVVDIQHTLVTKEDRLVAGSIASSQRDKMELPMTWIPPTIFPFFFFLQESLPFPIVFLFRFCFCPYPILRVHPLYSFRRRHIRMLSPTRDNRGNRILCNQPKFVPNKNNNLLWT